MQDSKSELREAICRLDERVITNSLIETGSGIAGPIYGEIRTCSKSMDLPINDPADP